MVPTIRWISKAFLLKFPPTKCNMNVIFFSILEGQDSYTIRVLVLCDYMYYKFY